MPVSVHDDPLILVCADLQVEYLAPGRRHVILDGDATTLRCLELLTLWRSNLWPVLHLKRIAQAAWFNPSSRLTDWIAETRPRPGEMTFEHPLPSAYSSSRFADYMSSIRNVGCVVTGFSSTKPSWPPPSRDFTAATATRWSSMPSPAGSREQPRRPPTSSRW